MRVLSSWSRRFVRDILIRTVTDSLPQMEDLIQEKVTQKENELNATYDEKMRNYEERYDATPSIFSQHDLHTFDS